MSKSTEEEYLRAFYYLKQKRGVARISDLASYLGVSKAGVSEMLSSLSERGLVRAKRYVRPNLTPRGLQVARKMTFKHRVLEVFLAKKLAIPPKRVHEEASRMEHAVSDATLKRLYEFLGRPKYDPHGSPISR